MTEFEKFRDSATPVTLKRVNCPGYKWIAPDKGETEVLIFGAFLHENLIYFTNSNNKTILSYCTEREKKFLHGALYYTRNVDKEYFGKLYSVVSEKPKSTRVGNKRITVKTRK